jgi:adenosylmethionine-8-amino-7-oxononanoate aminotransferase
MAQARGGSRARSWTGSRGLPKVSHGSGIYVFDSAGKRYLDASGGPAVYCLGHGHPEVTAAIVRQLERIAHGYRYTFTSDPLEQLRELITRACGRESRLDSMVFVSGGSEAVESALKVALQYHSARGEMTRRRFIARCRSWHGNTLGALAVSDFLDRRAPFEGALVEASFLPQVSLYRPPPLRSSKRRSCGSDLSTWRASSSSPWWAPRAAPCRRRRATLSRCARSASATGCCSLRMR